MAVEKRVTGSVDIADEMPDGMPSDDLVFDLAEEGVLDGEDYVEESEDGGEVVYLGGRPDESEGLPEEFSANLAEDMDDSVLVKIASEQYELFEEDKRSRSKWLETYQDGIKYLGFEIEKKTEPWPGACGITHPVLAEAVVRFQAQTIMEIFPADGPVKCKIVGKKTREKEDQSKRVKEYMNWLVTDKMEEYREEKDKMLFSLPLAGSAFTKTYWSETDQRPVCEYIPSEDLVVNYGAPSLEKADRITHVIPISMNEIRKLQVSGLYRDLDLQPHAKESDDVKEEIARATGEEDTNYISPMGKILEMHCVLDLPGYEDESDGEQTGVALPYILTIDNSSREVLSIYRNWDEGDELKTRKPHFTHYTYVPGHGFYGYGLVHLIGGITKGSTLTIRQLIDAGTLSNLPAGLKSSDFRGIGDDSPLRPGEWRTVQSTGMALRDGILPLPYKEPSAVLFQLMSSMVEEARRFASMNDINASDMSNEAPVGTTLAILERTLKVMTAIQARIHASIRKEFKILSRVIAENGPPTYPYDLDGAEGMKGEDFDGRIDVLPISDPNASTMAQKIIQHREGITLAAMKPEIYNETLLHRGMIRNMGFENADEIVPDKDDMNPYDPVTENVKILMGEPIKAFIWQDHDAHIQAHMAMMQDPKVSQLLQGSPSMKAVMGEMDSHMRTHIAYSHRSNVEKQLGTPMPGPEMAMPEDVEVVFSKIVAEAAQRNTVNNQAEAEQQEIQKKLDDPIIQQAERELAIKEDQAKAKIIADNERLGLEREKLDAKKEKDADTSILKLIEIISESEARGAELDVEIDVNKAKQLLGLLQTAVQAATNRGSSGNQ